MKVCPRCGSGYDDDDDFCGQDGERLESLGRPDLVGKTLAGDVTLTAVHEQGGFGTVYRGRSPRFDAELAVKVLHRTRAADAEAVARFRREVAAAAAVDHPGIVRVIDHGDDPRAGPFVVMPLLHGENLLMRMRRERPLQRATWEAVLVQAAAALGAAHAAGIVHRDVKPENLFLVPDPTQPVGFRVVVLDFGVARFVGTRSGDLGNEPVLTRPSQVIGSPLTISPEQVAGARVDHRADVYSLGVVLYEMLTGVVPFWHEKPGQILRAHLYDEPLPPSQRDEARWVPPKLDRFVLKMLAKRPGERFQSMAEVVRSWDVVKA